MLQETLQSLGRLFKHQVSPHTKPVAWEIVAISLLLFLGDGIGVTCSEWEGSQGPHPGLCTNAGLRHSFHTAPGAS